MLAQVGQATRFLQPSRQILPSNARLSRQLDCADRVLPREPLYHFLLEGDRVRLGHLTFDLLPHGITDQLMRQLR
jgi:hypothetical protein